MHDKKKNFWTYIATAYPLGYMPRAPGTWGSLPGLGVGALINYAGHKLWNDADGTRYFIFANVLVLAGIIGSLIVIDKTEKFWQLHDDRRIVLDEVLGQAIAIALLPLEWGNLLYGFILFRIFDIFKPWPIGAIDRKLPGAYGTLLDDVVAGYAAAFSIIVINDFL